MRKINIKLLVFLLFSVCFSTVKSQTNIIPVPVSQEQVEGILSIGEELDIMVIGNEPGMDVQLELFRKELSGLGISANMTSAETTTEGPVLQLVLLEEQNEEIGEEGYELFVESTGIMISANRPAGLFNGFQSLRQLMPEVRILNAEGKMEPIEIDGLHIKDYPRFGWRGLMLDVSRHFFTVEEVKAYIDQMAKFKFNVFHWHLTDDEGWRIEIKTFPRLTEVGAWRVERHGRFGSQRPYAKKSEKATYGGFYTQEEIREVVAYAQERNITIVPEIDVPGHSMALLAAYPELSTLKEYKHVNPGAKIANWFGEGKFEMIYENMLDPSNPAVYAFMDMVFEEIAGLFPGEFIHMGGDECYHGFWDRSEKVQAFMKENGIADSHELQSYFVKRMEEIISGKGKKMIGWDEILEGGLADGAAVMSWRGMKGGIEAARMGHEVVMSPTTFAYLDYTQGDHSVENKIYADLSLEKAYSFDPMPNPNLFVDIDPELILGGQGNLWTEVIPNLQYAFYMTYPRALALSESLWSPRENKDWDSFVKRTEVQFRRFEQKGTSIARTIYEPEIKVYQEGRKLMCELKTPFEDIVFYYTIDNTYPVKFGQKYEGPFEIPAGDLSLRVQSYRNGQPLERLLQVHRSDLEDRLKK